MEKELSQRLSKRLASFKLKDDVISKLAGGVIVEGLDLRKLDICAYGLCGDYFTTRVPRLEGLLTKPNIARVEVFPYGITNPDYFHVRVGFNVDELQAGRP